MGRAGTSSGRRIALAIGLLVVVLIALGVLILDLALSPTPRHWADQPQAAATLDDQLAELIADQRWDEASALLDKAVKQRPRDRQLRLRYAQVLQAQQSFDLAYEQLLEVLAIGPRDANTEFLAGMAASSAGYPEAAAQHFELALGGEPDNATYALHLGLVEFNLDRLGPAKAHLTMARQLDEHQAKAWGMLAQIELRQGRRAVAADLIARARQLNPDSIDWRIVQARTRLPADPQGAIDLLIGLSTEDLRRPDALAVLKSSLGMLGRFADAAALYARASDATPADAGLALETADLYERAGQIDDAVRYAARAARIGDPAAARVLTRLQERQEPGD